MYISLQQPNENAKESKENGRLDRSHNIIGLRAGGTLGAGASTGASGARDAVALSSSCGGPFRADSTATR